MFIPILTLLSSLSCSLGVGGQPLSLDVTRGNTPMTENIVQVHFSSFDNDLEISDIIENDVTISLSIDNITYDRFIWFSAYQDVNQNLSIGSHITLNCNYLVNSLFGNDDYSVLDDTQTYQNLMYYDDVQFSYNTSGIVSTDLFEVYFYFQFIDEQFYNSYQENDFVTGFDEGYDAGYDNGWRDANNVWDEEHGDEFWEEGYREGWDDAKELYEDSDAQITSIFTGILDIALVPVNFFLGILNFEVFGINIGGFVSGLLSVAIVIIIISSIVGGKKDD